MKKVEKILFENAEAITRETIAFALDRDRDDRARATLLPKLVEMIRPKKEQAPSVNVQQNLVVASHLGVPAGEVGPETQPAFDIPPLRQADSPGGPLEPIVAGELVRDGRAPVTTKAMYGEIPQTRGLTRLEAEYADLSARVPEAPPARQQDGPAKKVKW